VSGLGWKERSAEWRGWGVFYRRRYLSTFPRRVHYGHRWVFPSSCTDIIRYTYFFITFRTHVHIWLYAQCWDKSIHRVCISGANYRAQYSIKC
jgi:hypothetical protein